MQYAKFRCQCKWMQMAQMVQICDVQVWGGLEPAARPSFQCQGITRQSPRARQAMAKPFRTHVDSRGFTGASHGPTELSNLQATDLLEQNDGNDGNGIAPGSSRRGLDALEPVQISVSRSCSDRQAMTMPVPVIVSRSDAVGVVRINHQRALECNSGKQLGNTSAM